MSTRPCAYGPLLGVERPGGGRPVLLVHGNSCDHRIFERLMSADALAGRHLVALDLPGHGASPRSPAGRYGLRSHVDALVQAAASLGAGAVFGHSLGGHLCLQALAAGRLSGVSHAAVLGTPPLRDPQSMAEAFLPARSMALLFQGELTDADLDVWVGEAYPADEAGAFRAALRATDPAARVDLWTSVERGELADEVDVLDRSPALIAVLHATADPFPNPAWLAALHGRRLWRGGVQSIPGAGHDAPWSHPEAVAGLLAELLESG